MVVLYHYTRTNGMHEKLIVVIVIIVNSSFPVVSDILCEFLEVAIHLILYVREVYPSGIFQKRKKYNVPVQVQMNIVLLLYPHSF